MILVKDNTGASSILFDATAFDGVGAGAGTSQVTLNPISDLWIGSSTFMGAEGSFFIDGAGTGTLADTAGSTAGHWTLSVPMYAIWNGTRFDFPELTLSTEASYSYWDTASASQTLSGQIMDYGTGDAYLVGEANITDASHPFNGLLLVLGFHGNDPVVSPVPLPAAAWLFGGGLAIVL